MISDTLHDAIDEIDAYLEAGSLVATPEYDGVVYVRDVMEVMRCILDEDLEGYRPMARFHEDSKRLSSPPYSLYEAFERAKAENPVPMDEVDAARKKKP